MSRHRSVSTARDALAATFAGVTGMDVAFAARAVEVRARGGRGRAMIGQKWSRDDIFG